MGLGLGGMRLVQDRGCALKTFKSLDCASVSSAPISTYTEAIQTLLTWKL